MNISEYATFLHTQYGCTVNIHNDFVEINEGYIAIEHKNEVIVIDKPLHTTGSTYVDTVDSVMVGNIISTAKSISIDYDSLKIGSFIGEIIFDNRNPHIHYMNYGGYKTKYGIIS